MTDRYYGYAPGPSGRSPTFNPTRASMPGSIAYGSMYPGDMHVVPAESNNRHYTTPRGHTTSTNSSGVPTTTRTYGVTHDPRTRSGASLAPRDSSRTRRSTMDSTSRPPVIITTTHGPSEHQTNGGRSSSPIRDDYRASDGQFYTQPASSVRSRSAARPYHSSRSTDDYIRPRDRRDSLLSTRDADAYRSSRPSVVYPSDPRHSTAAIDYGDEGYQYMRPGELVKYDLDHSRGAAHRRQDSFDRGYYRPSVNYHPDQRSYNINSSHDLSRHSSLSSRPFEGRGGPPPSTRGFDKINRGYDKRDVPPSAPAPPPPPPTTIKVEGPGMSDARGGERRPRPLSLHQAAGPRTSHYGDYSRGRDDERLVRGDPRDRDYEREWDRGRDVRDFERRYDSPRFQDESIPTRGFGIRTDAPDDRGHLKDRRLDPRLDEPRKRSDEDATYVDDRSRDERRYARQRPVEDIDPRTERKRDDEKTERQEDPSKVKAAISSGLGVAASAVGLAPPSKPVDKTDHKSPSPTRRYSPPQEATTYADLEARDADVIPDRKVPTRSELAADRDRAAGRELSREHELGRASKLDSSKHEDLGRAPHIPSEAKFTGDEDHHRSDRRDTSGPVAHGLKEVPPPRSNVERSRASGSDSDETRRPIRRKGPISSAGGFDPKDTADLKQLKEQLAALEVKDERKDDEKRLSSPPSKERIPPPPKDRSPSQERTTRGSKETSPGPAHDREVVPATEPRHVRLVSPERDKTDDKPLRGILKQPRVSFPEEESYVREGVAPHKEDKKLKEVPPGAKWTKIKRQKVNPEALEIGQERFEARDDFVIVLRVLSKEEIDAYAAATQVLRERRRTRRKGEDEGRDKGRGDERDDDEDGERHRRHRRARDSDDSDDKGRQRERERDHDGTRERDREHDDERRRRQKRDDGDYPSHHHGHHHRSRREHERAEA